MANERIFIRCACSGPPAFLAKEWGSGIGDTCAAHPGAADQLERFFVAHRTCRIGGFRLCFEDETIELADLPAAIEDCKELPGGWPALSPSGWVIEDQHGHPFGHDRYASEEAAIRARDRCDAYGPIAHLRPFGIRLLDIEP